MKSPFELVVDFAWEYAEYTYHATFSLVLMACSLSFLFNDFFRSLFWMNAAAITLHNGQRWAYHPLGLFFMALFVVLPPIVLWQPITWLIRWTQS